MAKDDPPGFDRKAYMKEYNKRPDVVKKRQEYMAKYQRDKRAEKAAQKAADNAGT